MIDCRKAVSHSVCCSTRSSSIESLVLGFSRIWVWLRFVLTFPCRSSCSQNKRVITAWSPQVGCRYFTMVARQRFGGLQWQPVTGHIGACWVHHANVIAFSKAQHQPPVGLGGVIIPVRPAIRKDSCQAYQNLIANCRHLSPRLLVYCPVRVIVLDTRIREVWGRQKGVAYMAIVGIS